MRRSFPVEYALFAKADLEGIWDDLEAARGPKFADKYLRELEQSIESLSRLPRRYRVRRRLGKGRRILPLRPYHVIYRVEDTRVLILRIMHGRRKITRRTIELGR